MKHLILVLIAAILFAGCGSSTKLINSWSDKESTPKQYEKMAVAVLFPNSSNRYVTEQAVVEQLKEKGIVAMPTYDLFPLAGRAGEIVKLMEDSEAIKTKVKTKVKENNIDALMIITVFNKTTEERWVNDRGPGIGGTGYYGTPYAVPGAYYDYYAYSFGTIYDRGYFVDDVTYFVECNLYDVASEKLLWRAQTKSTNIESVEEEAKVLAYIVAKQLINKKVVEL
ncbi:MAG: hypothetical protein ABFS16_12175 [Bacteroidota bacterium]